MFTWLVRCTWPPWSDAARPDRDNHRPLSYKSCNHTYNITISISSISILCSTITDPSLNSPRILPREPLKRMTRIPKHIKHQIGGVFMRYLCVNITYFCNHVYMQNLFSWAAHPDSILYKYRKFTIVMCVVKKEIRLVDKNLQKDLLVMRTLVYWSMASHDSVTVVIMECISLSPT